MGMPLSFFLRGRTRDGPANAKAPIGVQKRKLGTCSHLSMGQLFYLQLSPRPQVAYARSRIPSTFFPIFCLTSGSLRLLIKPRWFEINDPQTHLLACLRNRCLSSSICRDGHCYSPRQRRGLFHRRTVARRLCKVERRAFVVEPQRDGPLRRGELILRQDLVRHEFPIHPRLL